MTARQIIQTALLSSPPPCERFNCRMQYACKTQKLACKPFMQYLNSGKAKDPSFARPTRKRYDRIFNHQSQLDLW